MSIKDTRAGLLYDYAVTRPEGFTYKDIDREFRWDRHRFLGVVRRLRSILGAEDITLTCTPGRSREPWVYQLVGTYDAARPWATNRVGDLESRLQTIHHVAQSLTNGSDGRTLEGKKARLIERTVRHLVENLADLAETK